MSLRANRVEEYIFPAFAVTGSEKAALMSEYAINGELLKIGVEGIETPGSVWIAESGTDIELFRKNDFTSGDSAVDFYPHVFSVDSINATGSPYSYTNRITNNLLYIAGSGLTSGTGVTLGPIKVYYR